MLYNGFLRKSINVIFCLILLVSHRNIYAQDSIKFEFIPKFHPTSLVIYRPTIMCGGEMVFFNKIGFDLAYGRQYIYNTDFDTVFVKPKGNRMKISIKYIVKNGFQLGGSYWKIYSQDNYQNWNCEDSFSKIENISVFTADFGYRFNYKRLMLEGMLSSGIKHKERKVNNTHVFIETMDTWSNGYWGYFPYKGNLLQLNVSFRIGYSLIRL